MGVKKWISIEGPCLRLRWRVGGVISAEIVKTPRGSFLPSFATTAYAQQSADYSDLTNWFQSNGGAYSYYDGCNTSMVSSFNRMNVGTWSPDDITVIANIANQMANYSYGSGNPTLDACTHMCAMKNVPSPGSASAVLFTNPSSSEINGRYSESQNYGYNATYDQIAGDIYVPSISTWNASNYFYPLCTEAASTGTEQVVSTLDAASAAWRNALRSGSGSWSLSESECGTLERGITLIRALAVISSRVALLGLLTGLEAVAAAAGAAALALAVVGIFAEAVRVSACPL